MAINFYSSISLNKNELQNAVVQNAGSDPGSPAAGQIYYNSGDNTLRVYNGSSFQTLSTTTGDITGVTAGAGLTGGGSSGSVTLNAIAGTGITVNANDIQTNDSEIVHDNLSGFVANEHIDHSGVTITAGTGLTGGGSIDGSRTINAIGGDGITANANDIAVTAAQTTITSVLNAALVLGRDADNQIKFGTDNQIIFRVGAGDGVTFKASGEIEATSLDISGDVDVDGTLEADAITLNGTALGALATLNTVSRTEIDADSITSGELADNAVSNEHLDTTAITDQTGLGNNFASDDSFLVFDKSAAALKSAEVSNLQTYLQSNLTFTTNTDVDVSNANLLTRLAALESAGGAANQNITIGTDSGDTIVITGNLQVQGTTTTVDSTTVAIGDHNIVLDKDNSTSAVVDGAGITLEGGTGDDVTFQWNASQSTMELKEGSSNANLKAGTFTGALTGTATTATTATNVTVSANNTANETVYLTFVDGATGGQGIETDTGLNYNPSTNVLTVGSVAGNLTGDVTGDVTGNADTATALATSRNLQVDLTSTSAQGFTGAANATSIGVSGELPIANSVAKVSSIVAGAGIDVSGATGDVTVTAESASTSNAGVVELATSAETQTGTDTSRAVTPDGLAARMVVADIDVSSLTDANIVTITHNLGTADVMVQVYDKTTEANIMCDIARTTDDFSTASTSVVSIDFGTAPPNDCRALITSLKGATASGTVAYT